MKRNLLVGVLLVASFFACEQDQTQVPDLPQKSTPNYFPMTTGSYWVYNCYKIDSLKDEQLFSENDTIRVIGDTIISGKDYKIFYGKRYGVTSTKTERYYRDSLGYIVQSNGTIVFSSANFSDTLYTRSIPDRPIPDYRMTAKMKTYDYDLDLLCGVFDSVLNCELNLEYLQTAVPLDIGLQHLYAPNVGKVLMQCCYVSQYERFKSYYEDRLVDYFIKED